MQPDALWVDDYRQPLLDQKLMPDGKLIVGTKQDGSPYGWGVSSPGAVSISSKHPLHALLPTNAKGYAEDRVAKVEWDYSTGQMKVWISDSSKSTIQGAMLQMMQQATQPVPAPTDEVPF